MKLFKNQWSNIIIAVVILVLIIPGTRKPLQIFANKIFSFSPSVTSKEDRESIAGYDWALEKNNRDRLDFSEYNGEVILVNFWATWCPPCIAEMPSFQELYNDYGDKINFLFVSSEDHQTVRGYLNRKNFTLPAYRPLSEAPQPLNGNTLPTTYLIDQQGNIVIQKVGAADWNSESVRNTIDKLLQQPVTLR
ncbi:TlpA family protein disulfide reductase [Antarcticibacterium sp. 1MA-6-2]|uniref:TlpA family protein disulfide reductase n=1 Tax=Antarcticibacterium sp. 1MA-6-2 TaxID=2908210 RepID=UPI001F20D55C|nr:TlpA disulfide reductase family protein [Antarcticibacterium sp. 1MA-6-2]UJH91149.1 TlpA family protein disulfide reductase [Antarcticibacterium sp. 1MA-6-2]